MKLRHFLRWFVLFVALFSLCGCAAQTQNSELAAFERFRCEVTGALEGLEVKALIEAEGERVTVTYLAPTALEGVVAVGEGDTWRVTAGSLVLADERTASALLQPAALLRSERGTPLSVLTEGDRLTTRRYADGSYLTVDADGLPTAYGNARGAWRVVWMECEKQ